MKMNPRLLSLLALLVLVVVPQAQAATPDQPTLEDEASLVEPVTGAEEAAPAPDSPDPLDLLLLEDGRIDQNEFNCSVLRALCKSLCLEIGCFRIDWECDAAQCTYTCNCTNCDGFSAARSHPEPRIERLGP